MELYKQTETDSYEPEAKVKVGALFIVVHLGWFSYAYLRDDEPISSAADKAIQLTEAIRLMEQ